MMKLTFTISLLAVCATVAAAQDNPTAKDIQRQIEIASTKANTTARQMEDALFALIPTPEGWKCLRRDNHIRNAQRGLSAIPRVSATCNHASNSLDVSISLEAATATSLCKLVESNRRGIGDGSVKPGLYQFFETGTWQLQRASVDITGCANGLIAFTAYGDRSEPALNAEPTAVDAFARAVSLTDVRPILGQFDTSGQSQALNHLVDLLNIQSQIMADLIPSPAGAKRKLNAPLSKETQDRIQMPLALTLASLPLAAAEIRIGECRVMVELTAGPIVLEEAKNTGRRWARKGGVNGHIEGAFMRHNTDRFVGQERVDGSGVEVLVDNSTIVRVVIPGHAPCQKNPGIVRELFDEIISHDLSFFGRR